MRLRSLVILLIGLVGAGCDRFTSDGSGTPESVPPWAIVPLAAGMPLDELLGTLEDELDAALGDGVSEDEMSERLLRAEAITDRLLDSRIPFDWLEASRYSVGSRLRQIQSLADRIVAQVQSRAPRAEVIADAEALRRDVGRLRAELAKGGGAAPPPLRELMTRDTVGVRRAPARQDTTHG